METATLGQDKKTINGCTNNMGNYPLVVTGINFRNTPLEIRSKLALTTQNISHIYENLRRINNTDIFILSTCNRTEIYSITDKPELLTSLFSQCRNLEPIEVKNHTYVKSGDEAVKHLFNVAAGLDSQILGDYEIVGQLKKAFALSKTFNCVSGLMEQLVNAALQASRQVRSNTSISDGTTSVSYGVIQLLKKELANKAGANICLIGLGKIGTLTLKNLRQHIPQHNVILINRNELKAEEAAGEYKVGFAKFDQQKEVLTKSDVLIVATSADHPFITKKDIEHSPIKLVFDLSVPFNVKDEVKEIDGLKIYDIDSLSTTVNKTIHDREKQIPLAEQIIEEHFAKFKEWERRRILYRSAETRK